MNLNISEINGKFFKWAAIALALVAVLGVSSCEQANGNNTKKPNRPVAPVIVRFDENIINVNIEGTDKIIHNGDTVYERIRLWLTLKTPPAGQQVDKWEINSKRLLDDGYTIVVTDAVDDAGQKVIEITCTLKPL